MSTQQPSTPARTANGGKPVLPPGLRKQRASEAGGTLVGQFFEANLPAIKAVLPEHMKPERMMKIALRCLRTTPKLMACTLESLFGAVITCSQLGLEPNTPQGHIYLIPFENKRKRCHEVQVLIGYKGLVDLARRSGEIDTLSTRPVFENDEFEIEYGTDESIRHRPCLDGDPGEMIGVYAVAKLKGGGVQFEFMPRSAIERIRDGSQGYQSAVRFNKNDNPWQTNFEEMARKTAIRRITKYLPSSVELSGALALDDRSGAQPQGLDKVLEGVDWSEVQEPDETEGGAGGEAGASEGAGQTAQVEHQQTVNTDLGQATTRQAETVDAGAGDQRPQQQAGPVPERRAEPTKAAAAAPAAPKVVEKPAAPAAPEPETAGGTPEEPAGLFGEME
jgi:recombination protein RecT